MKLCHVVFCALVATVIIVPPPTVRAEAPWNRLAVFSRRTEVDPAEMYTLDEKNGPWMILAVTFLGDDAQSKARELAHEMRQRFKLTAYTHEVRIKFEEPYEGDDGARYMKARRLKYQRDGDFKEVAVLVGDFASVDDPGGQKLLKRIKLLRPKCISTVAEEAMDDGRPLALLRMAQQEWLTNDNPRKSKGPLGHAFICTNPLLPREYFVSGDFDPFVIELNQDLDYSLLRCEGNYTVKVATFTGFITHNQKKIRDIKAGKDVESQLEKAAHKAHRMVELLRADGIEAYEYHTRQASMVTIGSFKSVGTPRTDGKIEIHPGIHKLLETYGINKNPKSGHSLGSGRSKELDGIPFDVQPLVIEVPRIPVSSQVARGPQTLR